MIPMVVTLNGGWISLNSLMLVDAPIGSRWRAFLLAYF